MSNFSNIRERIQHVINSYPEKEIHRIFDKKAEEMIKCALQEKLATDHLTMDDDLLKLYCCFLLMGFQGTQDAFLNGECCQSAGLVGKMLSNSLQAVYTTIVACGEQEETMQS